VRSIEEGVKRKATRTRTRTSEDDTVFKDVVQTETQSAKLLLVVVAVVVVVDSIFILPRLHKQTPTVTLLLKSF